MEKVAVIVLSGGFSSRMGTDKGLVSFKGSSMIERSLKLASTVTDTILIVANTPDYSQFGYPVCADILKEKGPIGGIHAGLSHSKVKYNLVLACDMPLMSVELLKDLIHEVSEETQVIVPRYQERFEPLCAIYNKDCLPQLELAANSTERSLHGFIGTVRTKILDVDESLPYYSPYLFSNVNNREELLKLEKIEQ